MLKIINVSKSGLMQATKNKMPERRKYSHEDFERNIKMRHCALRQAMRVWRPLSENWLEKRKVLLLRFIRARQDIWNLWPFNRDFHQGVHMLCRKAVSLRGKNTVHCRKRSLNGCSAYRKQERMSHGSRKTRKGCREISGASECNLVLKSAKVSMQSANKIPFIS